MKGRNSKYLHYNKKFQIHKTRRYSNYIRQGKKSEFLQKTEKNTYKGEEDILDTYIRKEEIPNTYI